MMPKKQWTNNIKAYSFLCDNEGRLHLFSIAKFLQESAWEHAEHCGAGYETLKPYGLVWILHGLKMEIDNYPSWGDDLVLETWGKNYETLFAYRDFEISYPASDIPSIKATSSWLLVNAETHRPVRITEELHKIPENQRYALTGKPGDIQIPEGMDSTFQQTVAFSDIDVYNHANNTSYIKYCIDAAPGLHSDGNIIRSFDIKYIQEAKLGDILGISSSFQNGVYYFQGINQNTRKEIFRAKAELA